MIKLADATQVQEKKATRAAYGVTLAQLADEGMPVVAVDADLTGSTTTKKFAAANEAYADRLYNVGIAEQNMIDVAAGLSLTGNIAFTGSFAVFGTGRAYDQIRNTVCYGDLNVKIAPTHAGISVGPDGGSHQMLEDISLMRGLPKTCAFSFPPTTRRLALRSGLPQKPRVLFTFVWAALPFPPCTPRASSSNSVALTCCASGTDATIVVLRRDDRSGSQGCRHARAEGRFRRGYRRILGKAPRRGNDSYFGSQDRLRRHRGGTRRLRWPWFRRRRDARSERARSHGDDRNEGSLRQIGCVRRDFLATSRWTLPRLLMPWRGLGREPSLLKFKVVIVIMQSERSIL